MKKFLTTAISAAVTTCLVSPAFAGPADSKSAKNPFVVLTQEVNTVKTNLKSLEDQVAELVGRVDSLEQKVTANTAAIGQLQQQDTYLKTLIDQNISDINSIQLEMDRLLQVNAELQQRISDNNGSIEELQLAMDTNNALINLLQTAIDDVESNSATVTESLQTQLDNHSQLITYLQNDIDLINASLELKQNIVTGSCPNGYAIRAVREDGTVICEAVTGGSSGSSVSTYTLFAYFHVPANAYGAQHIPCYAGDVSTGAGYAQPYWYNVSVTRNYAYGTGSFTEAYNRNPYSTYMYSVTNCMRISK